MLLRALELAVTVPIHATKLRRTAELRETIQDVAKAEGAIYVDGYAAVPHDLRHIRDSVHLFDAGSEALAEGMAKTLLADPRFIKLVESVRSETGSAARRQ